MKYSRLCPHKCPFCHKKLKNKSGARKYNKNEDETQFFYCSKAKSVYQTSSKHPNHIAFQYDIKSGTLLLLRISFDNNTILEINYKDNCSEIFQVDILQGVKWLKRLLKIDHVVPINLENTESIKNKIKLCLTFQ